MRWLPRRRSLQRRVVLGGFLWAAVATLIGTFGVFYVFDRIADRRFNAVLLERHTRVVAALGNLNAADGLETYLTDPSYQRPYSGRYWQVTRQDGALFTSPSLFDTELPRRDTPPVGTELWESDGPDGRLRGLREAIILPDGSRWTVSVAASLGALNAERAEMRRSVALGFGFVGLFGMLGAALLTSVLVSPLRKLQNDVVHRWESDRALDPDEYPAEVAPLVADINELLSRNRGILSSGRRQAADLAHALKTPSAALRNELLALSRRIDGTAPLFEALERIDAQIKRSLARMRAETASYETRANTDLGASVARLERLFRSLPEAAGRSFEVRAAPAARVAVDPQDLEEMLGNLLENAFKWCRAQVSLTVSAEARTVLISVEDDGPGIAAEHRDSALEEGARFDTSVPGTGLGLSITSDLARAYGGELELLESPELGGLRARIRLPLGHRPIGRTTAGDRLPAAAA